MNQWVAIVSSSAGFGYVAWVIAGGGLTRRDLRARSARVRQEQAAADANSEPGELTPLPSGGVSERITPDDVANVARLARLGLTDDELDAVHRPARRHARPLRRHRRARPRRRRADDPAVPARQRAARRRRRARRSTATRCWPRRPAVEDGRFRVPPILGLERADVTCRRSRSPPRSAPASADGRRRASTSTSPRIDAREGELHAFNLVLADEARAAADADRRARSPPATTPARSPACRRAQGQHVHPGHPHHVLVADPRGLEAAVRRHRRRRGSPPPAPSSSARPTSTSSPWARRTENSAFGPTRNPHDTDPGARRLARRQRRRGGRRLRRRSRSAPTPAARSASPPRCAASSA